MALTNPQETIDERPSCCEYTAGRMFYGMKNNIYYSQVMEGESIDKLGHCFQANDPTAEQLSDLIATDGGVLEVDNAFNIKEIKKFLNGVLIYAENGVWYLSGPTSGFTATEFSLRLITESGCISPASIVQVEGHQYYWGYDGIYLISVNKFGEPEVSSIVEGVIQSLYNDIPKDSKEKSCGAYNRLKKQVEWHYSSTAQTGATDYSHAKDKSLLLDIRSGGFWPQEYAGIKTEGLGKFLIGGIATNGGTEDNHEIKLLITAGAPSTTQVYSLDLAYKTEDSTFLDYSTEDITAYVETGYEALDKPSNKKTAPYVTTHFNQTEENWVSDGSGGFELDKPSGCTLRAKWDWSDSTANGRWSPSQQAYRFRRTYIPSGAGTFDSGETVITTKNKVLGRGSAVALRFEKDAGKDMQLLGYTVEYSMKGRI